MRRQGSPRIFPYWLRTARSRAKPRHRPPRPPEPARRLHRSRESEGAIFPRRPIARWPSTSSGAPGAHPRAPCQSSRAPLGLAANSTALPFRRKRSSRERERIIRIQLDRFCISPNRGVRVLGPCSVPRSAYAPRRNASNAAGVARPASESAPADASIGGVTGAGMSASTVATSRYPRRSTLAMYFGSFEASLRARRSHWNDPRISRGAHLDSRSYAFGPESTRSSNRARDHRGLIANLEIAAGILDSSRRRNVSGRGARRLEQQRCQARTQLGGCPAARWP